MTNADADLKTFLSMINAACAEKMKELDRDAFVAQCMGSDATDVLAERRRRLIDLPGTIKPGTREHV
jgi:hypothetical protein